MLVEHSALLKILSSTQGHQDMPGKEGNHKKSQATERTCRPDAAETAVGAAEVAGAGAAHRAALVALASTHRNRHSQARGYAPCPEVGPVHPAAHSAGRFAGGPAACLVEPVSTHLSADSICKSRKGQINDPY